MSFDTLGLPPALLKAIQSSGYQQPTAVQAQAIPAALQGKDLMVSSSTGSGKTAAFLLPALAKLQQATRTREKGPRILVLAPTRELALQVAKACAVYGREHKGLKICTVLGGVPYGLQLKQLRGPLDVLIATPGRLIDHLQSGKADLSRVDTLILDEADRMLDMGFIEDIETIAAATPKTRQTMMFSATFEGYVAKLAANLLNQPLRIDVASHRQPLTNIEQRLHWADNFRHKNELLDHLLRDADINQALVFTSTQRDTETIALRLEEQGHAVAVLHGGMPQGKRNRMLRHLREGHVRVLVATDVAARGIDVPAISHVINYGLPMNAEDYVHRIGRTGRAGRSGIAVTLAEARDQGMIRRIEKFTANPIPVQTVVGLEPKLAGQKSPSAKPAGRGRSSFGAARPGTSKPGSRPAKKTWGQSRDGQRAAPAPKSGQGFGRATPKREQGGRVR
ncbi:MAG: DEAD/DEAH box helicase [Burkholderiales bacterium]|jgi:superfamily II DNA/RNA helicase|nr:DEAD/DEAH box helicase [Burkholderiales bacterium]